FLEGRPILARPAGAWEKTVKWARRRPTQAALVATGLLAVLAGLAGAVFYGLYKDQQAAYDPQQLAAAQAQLERGKKIDALWGQGQEAEAAGQLVAAAGHYEQALGMIDEDRADLRDDIGKRLDQVQQCLGKQAARQGALDRADDFRKLRNRVLFHAVNFTER